MADEQKKPVEGKAKPVKADKADKGDKAAKDKPQKAPASLKKMEEDFKYIVRIRQTDIDGKKPAIIGLSSIKGVGMRIAELVIREIDFPRNEKIGRMKDPQIEQVEKIIAGLSETLPEWMVNRQHDFETGESVHLLGSDMDTFKRDDINRMKMIRCYKGIRHEQGGKVRGQRTRSNGRTGLTLGVVNGEVGAKAAAPEKEEKK
ncbi:MAG: 30S ribosomal protein S13 [Methanobacteriota archaeon]